MREISERELQNLQRKPWSEYEVQLQSALKKLIDNDQFCQCKSDFTPLSRFFSSVYIQWNGGWSADASVTVKRSAEEVTFRDKTYWLVTVSCEIGWASNIFTVSTATAAMAMHKRAIEFSALIEAMFQGIYLDTETA